MPAFSSSSSSFSFSFSSSIGWLVFEDEDEQEDDPVYARKIRLILSRPSPIPKCLTHCDEQTTFESLSFFDSNLPPDRLQRRYSASFLVSSGIREHDKRNYYRSEEHTSELQSHSDLVCRLLLEKK